MSSARRLLLTFTAPVALLGAIAASVWVSTSSSDRAFGPMLRVPTASRSSILGDGMAPPLNLTEKLSPVQAELRNALIPFSHVGFLAPAQFSSASANGEDPSAALECLTSAIYYEAGHEPLVGQQAVAQVVVNRRASASFPKTICGVVQQGAPKPGCQFTFECDGSLARRPDPGSWASARTVAEAALNGFTLSLVGAATHYHADYVVPVWATTMIKLVKLGHHIFYRWAGARLTFAPPSSASPEGSLEAVTSTPTAPAATEATPTFKPFPTAPVETTAPAPAEPPALIDPEPLATPAASPGRPASAPRPPSAPSRRAIPEQTLRGGGPL